MTKPLSPMDLSVNIPDEVIEVFNILIAKAWDGTQAVVWQDKAVRDVADKLHLTTGEVYEKHYLDVEDTYRQAGWKVTYEKPGWDETFHPHFVFKKV